MIEPTLDQVLEAAREAHEIVDALHLHDRDGTSPPTTVQLANAIEQLDDVSARVAESIEPDTDTGIPDSLANPESKNPESKNPESANPEPARRIETGGDANRGNNARSNSATTAPVVHRQPIEAAVVDEAPAAANMGPDSAAQSASPDGAADKRAELVGALAAAGLNDRLGLIFVSGSPPQPEHTIDHWVGLPDFDLCVQPDYSPIDGANGIFVSATSVVSAQLSRPLKENAWRVVRAVPYDSPGQLVQLIRQFAAQPAR